MITANILYIDDDEDLCKIFKDSFEDAVKNVKVAVTKTEAIQAIKTSIFDVIFIDYNLRGIKGDQLKIEIMQEIAVSPKAYILVTGDSIQRNSQNFDFILHKPFKLDEAHTLIKKIIT